MSFNQQREVAIFWDYENIALPKGCHPADACKAITRAVSAYGKIVDRRCYFDYSSDYGREIWSSLDNSGFDLVNTPHRNQKETLDKKLIVDVWAYAWDAAGRNNDPQHGQPVVVLITSDGDYAYTVNKLQDRGITSVVIIGQDCSVAHNLTAAADVVLSFEQDVLKSVEQQPPVAVVPQSPAAISTTSTVSEEMSPNRQEQQGLNNVFLKSIPKEVSVQELVALLEAKVGGGCRVVRAQLVPAGPGKSFRFAKVKMEAPQQAKSLVESSGTLKMNNRAISVEYDERFDSFWNPKLGSYMYYEYKPQPSTTVQYKPQGSSTSEGKNSRTTVFVNNVPPDVDVRDLVSFLETKLQGDLTIIRAKLLYGSQFSDAICCCEIDTETPKQAAALVDYPGLLTFKGIAMLPSFDTKLGSWSPKRDDSTYYERAAPDDTTSSHSASSQSALETKLSAKTGKSKNVFMKNVPRDVSIRELVDLVETEFGAGFTVERAKLVPAPSSDFCFAKLETSTPEQAFTLVKRSGQLVLNGRSMTASFDNTSKQFWDLDRGNESKYYVREPRSVESNVPSGDVLTLLRILRDVSVKRKTRWGDGGQVGTAFKFATGKNDPNWRPRYQNARDKACGDGYMETGRRNTETGEIVPFAVGVAIPSGFAGGMYAQLTDKGWKLLGSSPEAFALVTQPSTTPKKLANNLKSDVKILCYCVHREPSTSESGWVDGGVLGFAFKKAVRMESKPRFQNARAKASEKGYIEIGRRDLETNAIRVFRKDSAVGTGYSNEIYIRLTDKGEELVAVKENMADDTSDTQQTASNESVDESSVPTECVEEVLNESVGETSITTEPVEETPGSQQDVDAQEQDIGEAVSLEEASGLFGMIQGIFNKKE